MSNNTCVMNDTGITFMDSTAGMSSLVVQNNIIIARNVDANPMMQINPGMVASRFRNNIYYGTVNSTFYWADQEPRSFAGWVSVSREVHSSYADPLLADPTAVPPQLWDDPERLKRGSPLTALSIESYSLTPSSPAIDSGVEFASAFTFFDRLSHRDIGALEFCKVRDRGTTDSVPGAAVCEAKFLPAPPATDPARFSRHSLKR